MNGYIPEAYSRLASILARQNLSVLSLQRTLEEAGVPVNIKSLYRLTEHGPLQKIGRTRFPFSKIINEVTEMQFMNKSFNSYLHFFAR